MKQIIRLVIVVILFFSISYFLYNYYEKKERERIVQELIWKQHDELRKKNPNIDYSWIEIDSITKANKYKETFWKVYDYFHPVKNK